MKRDKRNSQENLEIVFLTVRQSGNESEAGINRA